MIRIGHSVDIHRLEPGESFKLGGVDILGYTVIAHSDGDCLYHALAESILGSLALGSLGENYPDNEDIYKDIDSSYFVKDACKKLQKNNYKINNIDMMVCLEKPKIKDHLEEMRKNVAKLLDLELNRVSIKPTTYETLGIIGESRAVKVYSTVLVDEI